MHTYADLCLVTQRSLQIPGIPVDGDYMAVCIKVGIYLQASLVWLYKPLRECSADKEDV